ncbi:hypothetical protein [Brevundimonas sp. NIBR11]|uniref:hypothetical protein n=1 Tax=Brevundimonas sp. NIBR11 TaxID=3015999 RepID=UPI0022F0114A|nr:hypothetical protein [Brevundimonas sp. NIBR11]
MRRRAGSIYRRRVTHAGAFGALEKLMAIGAEDDGGLSLDPADALVWPVSSVMLEGGREGRRARAL